VFRFVAGWRRSLPCALAVLCCGCQGLTATPRPMPAGSADDVAYARTLWSALQAAGMVGPHARELEPFIGAARPHGWVLELSYRTLTVGDHTGFVVMKNNYNGDGLTVEQVRADRARYLSSVTVMYQREAGYDADNQDWFWVKYRPDGALFAKKMGSKQIPMAGRMFKGRNGDVDRGCIYCHKSAGGGDYIFYPEIVLPETAR